MSLPNVAVAFPQATIDSISAAITGVTALFPVHGAVGPDDRKGLQKVAEGREPYIAEAFTDALAAPATVPGSVNMATWALLEQQYAGLDQCESLVEGLLEMISGLKAVAGDQRYRCTRKYYDYLDGNLDVLPGAQTIRAKIAKLFEKQGPQPTPPPSGGTPPP